MLGFHLASLLRQRRRGLATGCMPLASHYVPPGLLFLPSVAWAPLRRTRSGGAKRRNGGCGVVASWKAGVRACRRWAPPVPAERPEHGGDALWFPALPRRCSSATVSHEGSRGLARGEAHCRTQLRGRCMEDVYMLGCHLASLLRQRRRGLATGCLPLASHYVPPGLLFLPSVARAPLRRTRSGGAKGRNGGCGVVA